MASGVTKMEVSIVAQVLVQGNAHAFTMFTKPPCFQNVKNLRKEIAVSKNDRDRKSVVLAYVPR